MSRFALIVGAALVVVGIIATMVRLTLGMESAQDADSLKFSETNALVRLQTTIRADQHGSILFVPSKDVFGNSQPVGLVPITPGPNGTGTEGIANPGAHEADEYNRDAQHVGHWIGWYYDAAKHEIDGYRYAYRDANGNAVGLNSTPFVRLPGIAWFSASYLLASQLPQVDAFIYGADQHAGLPACPADNQVHEWEGPTVSQPTAPCQPFDVLIPMGFPGVYGGNRAVVMDMEGMPPSGAPAYPFGQGPSDLRLHLEAMSAIVPLHRVVTVYYSPPPAGALNVSPLYMEYRQDTQTWVDSSKNALAAGDAVAVSESWYARPWTATQSSCTMNGSAVDPTQVFSLAGGATSQSAGVYAVADTPHRSPASPWPSGPFAGSTTGYSDGGFQVVPNASLTNPQPITCALAVASTDAKTATVQVVIDPSPKAICPNGSAGPYPACPTPTPTPATYRWQDRTTVSCAYLGHLLSKCNQADDVTLQESIGGGSWGSVTTCAFSSFQKDAGSADGGGGVYTSYSYTAQFAPYDSDPIASQAAGFSGSITGSTTSGCPA